MAKLYYIVDEINFEQAQIEADLDRESPYIPRLSLNGSKGLFKIDSDNLTGFEGQGYEDVEILQYIRDNSVEWEMDIH